MRLRRKVRRVGGMARVGGVWFVGEGWTPEKIQRVLRSPFVKRGCKPKPLDRDGEAPFVIPSAERPVDLSPLRTPERQEKINAYLLRQIREASTQGSERNRGCDG